MQLKAAFALLDEYNNPATTETRSDAIVEKLYKAGYIIRPVSTVIIKSETEYEHLNPGSREWGLVDRQSRRPVKRPI